MSTSPMQRSVQRSANTYQASRDARRVCALILEVLGGLRTIAEASEILGVAPARFHVLERRAVEGMLRALEPRPRGRPRSEGDLVASLEQKLERLQAELARLESLHRLSQRAIGLPAESTPPTKAVQKAAKGGARRRKARATRHVVRLRSKDPEKSAPDARDRAEASVKELSDAPG